MGNKAVEFQSERIWEWSLEELWRVIYNGVVSVYEIIWESNGVVVCLAQLLGFSARGWNKAYERHLWAKDWRV